MIDWRSVASTIYNQMNETNKIYLHFINNINQWVTIKGKNLKKKIPQSQNYNSSSESFQHLREVRSELVAEAHLLFCCHE